MRMGFCLFLAAGATYSTPSPFQLWRLAHRGNGFLLTLRIYMHAINVKLKWKKTKRSISASKTGAQHDKPGFYPLPHGKPHGEGDQDTGGPRMIHATAVLIKRSAVG